MKCLHFCLCLLYYVHVTYCIYDPEDLTVKPLTVKKTTWRKPAKTPQEVEMHHGYSRVQRITPQPGAPQQPSRRQPKIDPQWHNTVPVENKSEPLENDKEREEKRPEQQIRRESTTERQKFVGLEKMDLIDRPEVSIGSRNKLDEEVIVIDDKLAPMEDPIQIHDKLDKLDTSSSEIKKTSIPSTGLSNIPLPEGEIDVFGFHWPPRDYEVYPFKKTPKPYSNMAFEKCPKGVTGQLVFYWSCSQYLNCYKGRGYISNCGPGTMFNPETLECDYPEKVSCITGTHNQQVMSEKLISAVNRDLHCPKDFSGLMAYPNDCTKFLNCNSGSTYVQTCGPGTVFNPKISACDHPYNTECNLEASRVPLVDENEGYFDLRSTGQPRSLPTLKEVQKNYSAAYREDRQSNYDLVVGETRSHGSYQAAPGRQFHVYSSQAPGCSGKPCQAQNQQVGSQPSACQGGGCQVGTNAQTSGCQSGGCQQASGNQFQQGGASGSYQGSSTSYQGRFTQTGCQGSACPQSGAQGGSNFDKIMTTSGRINCPPLETLQGAASSYSAQYVAQGSQNANSRSVEDSGSIKCPPGQTGLLPHPLICEKFLNCANGRTHVQDCGPGTVFNPNIQACDWPKNVNCKSQRGNRQSSNYQVGREIEFSSSGSSRVSQTGSASQQHLSFANLPQECQELYRGQTIQRGAPSQGFSSRGHGKAQPIPTWMPKGQPPPPGFQPIYTGGIYPQPSGHHIPQYIPQRQPPTTPRGIYTVPGPGKTHTPDRRPTYSMTSSVSSSGGHVPGYTNGHSFPYPIAAPGCAGCPPGTSCPGCPQATGGRPGYSGFGQPKAPPSSGDHHVTIYPQRAPCAGCPPGASCPGCPRPTSGQPSYSGFGQPSYSGFGQPKTPPSRGGHHVTIYPQGAPCAGCPPGTSCPGCPQATGGRPGYSGFGQPKAPPSSGFPIYPTARPQGGQGCAGCPPGASCPGCPQGGGRPGYSVFEQPEQPEQPGAQHKVPIYPQEASCANCPPGASCPGCPQGTSGPRVTIYPGSTSQGCAGCPPGDTNCPGCPQGTPMEFDGQSRVPDDFGGQNVPSHCQGCVSGQGGRCQGCPDVPKGSFDGQQEVPVYLGTRQPTPSPKGRQPVDSYPAGSDVDHHKVPFDFNPPEPKGSGPKPSVDYEDFEGMSKVPVFPESSTPRDYTPIYVIPNLGPTIYVKPQTGLQPPHEPPKNRTIYIRPPIPNIQTQDSGRDVPSYSHTGASACAGCPPGEPCPGCPQGGQPSGHPSPHVPVYRQPEPNPTESRFRPTTTERTSIYVQRIPPRGTNNTSPPVWPPPFPKTDIEADYDFEDHVTTPEPTRPTQKYWKTSHFCGDDQFECGIRDCIPRNWVCNGVQDCPNGADERNCSIYLTHFTLIPNSRLFKHELEKWLNTDLDTCSNYCMHSKGFQCKSFNYRRDDKVCLLCDTNVGLSGALAPSPIYDYYELKDFTVDCSNRYECSNKKCIEFSQVCDGNDDCGNRQDEKNCNPTTIDYEIRLAGSHNPNEGRIEVKVFGEWGYICDDQFGLRDAHVACKELGYHLGALEVKTSSWFATEIKDNDTFYLMDDVDCLGNETSLRDCDFNGWGTHNCMPQEIVGVICKTPQEQCPENEWQCDTGKECLPFEFVCDGVFDCGDKSDEGAQHCDAPIEVRLANGSSKMEGRVEVKYHGMWGTVCDDDFNDMAAKVICRSLGYYGSAIAKKDGAFGPGIGPIWLDQVNCAGNESFIQDCHHMDWGQSNCEHTEDAAVICSKAGDSMLEKSSRDRSLLDSINIIPTGETLHPVKCGHRNEDVPEDDKGYSFRVVSGSAAKKGQYPWQATIRVKSKTKSAHWCGAVIISNKFLLTAAHCLVGFAKGAYFIRAGDYDVDTQEGTEQEANIEDFFIHEQFRQGGHMNNDVAIIKLKGNGLKMSKHVQPICLPEKDAVYRDKMNCTISGFGSTQMGKSTSSRILRAGWVPIQKQDVCKLESVYGKAITDGMICAGSLDEGVDSCDGDSGGPLACLDKGLFTLYGITSWGQHCGHANKPGVYVKVAYYREWIDKKIEENS